MSIILDALRKSDAARQAYRDTPLQEGPRPARAPGPPLWLLMIFIAVAGVLVAIAARQWWLNETTRTDVVSRQRVADDSDVAGTRPLWQIADEGRAAASGNPAETASPAERVSEIIVREATATDLPRLEEMPPAFQQSLAGLEMNAHAWDSAPDKRFVLINFRRYAEGERLREGPTVKQITAEGAVLEYNGQEFLLTTR